MKIDDKRPQPEQKDLYDGYDNWGGYFYYDNKEEKNKRTIRVYPTGAVEGDHTQDGFACIHTLPKPFMGMCWKCMEEIMEWGKQFDNMLFYVPDDKDNDNKK